MTTFIDFHALHTLAPSNVNRGEDGAPKSAVFGGVRRQRISSQALKAAQRKAFGDHMEASDLGVRTKRVVELAARKVVELDPSVPEEQALAWAEAAFAKAGIKIAAPKKPKADEDAKKPAAGYLMFLGNHQIERFAQKLIEYGDEGFSTKKEAQQILDSEHSVDVALFGRMVADDASLNVDAAVQMAHGLGVHSAEPDFDFYTAVDDLQRQDEETGAGMMGTIEMMSSTIYRYATINVDLLISNLGSKVAAARAVKAFATTYVETLPSGKQNTFASHTLPEVVAIAVRDRRPVSYVNAFETPVAAAEAEDRRLLAAQRMADEAQSVESTYGLVPTVKSVIAVPSLRAAAEPLGESVTLTRLLEQLGEVVESVEDAGGETA